MCSDPVVDTSVFAALRVLPVRQAVGTTRTDLRPRRWLVELFIPAGSQLIGAAPLKLDLFRSGGSRGVDLFRGDTTFRRSLDETGVQAGDIVVVKTCETETMTFRDTAASVEPIAGTEHSTTRRTTVVEAKIRPNTRALWRKIGRIGATTVFTIPRILPFRVQAGITQHGTQTEWVPIQPDTREVPKARCAGIP